MHPKDAAGIANSVDPGLALFAQTCLSENLGTLRYVGTVLKIFIMFILEKLHRFYSHTFFLQSAESVEEDEEQPKPEPQAVKLEPVSDAQGMKTSGQLPVL